MGQPHGYLLLELVILLAVGGVVVSAVLTLQQTLLTAWEYHHSWANLQQAGRSSMNSIVERLQSAVKIKVVSEKKIIFWPPTGGKQKIFYQPGAGLCVNDVRNKISNRVTEVAFLPQNNDLLLVQLAVEQNNKDWKLQTAVGLEAD